MRYDKKENTILQIRLFFNTSIFHFIGTSKWVDKYGWGGDCLEKLNPVT